MPSAQTSGSTRRSPILIAAIATAAALAIAAVIVLLILNDDEDPAATPPTDGPSTAIGSRPGSQVTATTPPTAAPPGVTWALVGQAAVPASASEGPARTSGCTASGFAHTPVGALIAAAQISTRSGYYAGRSCWEPTINSQVHRVSRPGSAPVPVVVGYAVLDDVLEGCGVPGVGAGQFAQGVEPGQEVRFG